MDTCHDMRKPGARCPAKILLLVNLVPWSVISFLLFDGFMCKSIVRQEEKGGKGRIGKEGTRSARKLEVMKSRPQVAIWVP